MMISSTQHSRAAPAAASAPEVSASASVNHSLNVAADPPVVGAVRHSRPTRPLSPAMEVSVSGDAGGSDDPVDLVEAVLNTSPVCGTCVAIRTHLPLYDVEIILKVLVRIGAVRLDIGPYDCCHRPGAFSKSRPAS